MKFITSIGILLTLLSCRQVSQSWTIESPSGNLKVQLSSENGNLNYAVTSSESGKESVILLPSPLGLERDDALFFGNLEVDSLSKIREISDTYTMISGKQKKLSYKANEAILSVKNKQGQHLDIVFRIFNEGLAFRYIFNDKSEESFKVLSEKTGFKIPETAQGWVSPYEPSNGYGQPGYEKDYLAVKVGDTSPDSIGWAFPLLFSNENHWLLISESGLDANYCGSHVDNNKGSGLYSIAFP